MCQAALLQHFHPFLSPASCCTGDIHRYDELCTKYAAMLNAQPALVAHERRLREKITILCLMVRVGGSERAGWAGVRAGQGWC